MQPDEGLNLNYGFELAPQADPGRRQAYSVLKTALAAAHPADRGAYLAGKDEFITGLLRRL